MERAQILRRYRETGDDQPFREDRAMKRMLCHPFLPIRANDVDSKDMLDRRREFDLSWSSPAQMLSLYATSEFQLPTDFTDYLNESMMFVGLADAFHDYQTDLESRSQYSLYLNYFVNLISVLR